MIIKKKCLKNLLINNKNEIIEIHHIAENKNDEYIHKFIRQNENLKHLKIIIHPSWNGSNNIEFYKKLDYYWKCIANTHNESINTVIKECNCFIILTNNNLIEKNKIKAIINKINKLKKPFIEIKEKN